jgi:thioredoxin reductase
MRRVPDDKDLRGWVREEKTPVVRRVLDDKNLLDWSRGWVSDFEEALDGQDRALFDELFLADSYWRDLVAFTWDTRQFWGRDTVREELFAGAATMRPSNFRRQINRSLPRLLASPSPRVEIFFAFDTDVGTGSAFLVLRPDETAKWGMRARLVATTMTGLHCNPAPPVSRRGYEPAQPGESWIEYRQRVRNLDDREPEVLIVGGGQSGLSVAAHLDRLGVSYVAVERNERCGDSWRKRYAALALHTPTCANNLPFTLLPPTFPKFMSKDQWANWVDGYAQTMDLNVWTSTEFLDGSFEVDEMTWEVQLRGADGQVRVVRPKHVVMALGFTGIEPVIPDMPGLKSFSGSVTHSSAFGSAEPFRGKKVLVIGTATSGHDIALDLYHHGAHVTMGQRGPACVVPVLEAERYNDEYLEPGLSVAEIDQRRNANFVYPLIIEKLVAETERTEAEYAAMFAGLRKAGLALTVGHDRTGWLMKLHRTFSGYYLDVGASQVIIDGGIKVLQLGSVATFTTDGVQLIDGSVQHFDAVVLSTGYKNMSAVLEKLLGHEVAERVGPIGGIGDDGEPRNMCRPTGQPHLWMVYGGIMDARKTSELLALQLVANLRGVVPSFVRTADGTAAPVGTVEAHGASRTPRSQLQVV